MGAAVDAGLDTVATVAQLAGTAASHLSTAKVVGGIIKMILELAQTARRNKKECKQLAGRVPMILDLLPYLQDLEETATRAPLEALAATLREALELVKSCQGGSMVGRVFTSNLRASELADVQGKIDFYLLVFPTISHIAISAALDRLRIETAASSRISTSVPPPASHQPVPVVPGEDDITWAMVAAASTVSVVCKTAGVVVYKAMLQDGRHVAIKSYDGDEEAFRAELSVVSSLRHQHIVRLLCWWEGDGNHLLVYEYVGSSTLRSHLRLSRGGECTSWSTRMEVLLAAARAIEHLHRHAIVHGNIGSDHILLDASRKPCVSGFGASVVNAVGSRTAGRLESTAAGDVRRFGVVMLEVLTGREPILSICKEEGKKGEVDVTLESFALPSIKAGKLGDVLDIRPAAEPTPRQLKALKLVADMAARCVSPSSSPPGKEEPTMSDVVAHLKEALEIISSDDTNKLAFAVVCLCFALSLYRGSLLSFSFSLLLLAGLLIFCGN
uniref:Uncharacterized protein n=1 Tax=Avena sativa TaxID=4498 RepID=A0ACD5TXP9_AVESA